MVSKLTLYQNKRTPQNWHYLHNKQTPHKCPFPTYDLLHRFNTDTHVNESINQINIMSPLSTLPIFSPIVWYQPASFMFWNAIVNSAELSSVQLTSNTVAARSMKGLLMATVFIPVTMFGFFTEACPLVKRARYRHSISESSRLITWSEDKRLLFFTTCTSDDGEASSLLGMASNALSSYQYGKGVDRVYHQKKQLHHHYN